MIEYDIYFINEHGGIWVNNKDQKNIKERKEEQQTIEVWEDFVRIKDLCIALIISTVTTLGGYLIAPKDSTRALIFGLIGAVIGFLISSLAIQPKRTFQYIEKGDE